MRAHAGRRFPSSIPSCHAAIEEVRILQSRSAHGVERVDRASPDA